VIGSIAHPTDLSPEGAVAFEHALGLALARRCRLDVLHVSGPGERTDWDGFPHVREMLQRWGLIDPGAPIEAVFARTGVSVRKVGIHDHDPVGGLARFLEEHPAELIVMATHGRAGLDRLFNVSVSAELVHVTGVPALILGPAARPLVDTASGRFLVKSVVVPVDHDPDPNEVMAVLDELAEGLGLPLDFVHVGESAPRLRDGREVRLLEGPVIDALLAEAQRASVLAMPTAGPRGLLEALRGSTTERVVRDAPCPILAIPVGS